MLLIASRGRRQTVHRVLPASEAAADIPILKQAKAEYEKLQ
jgi:hypothetical protein